MEYLTLLMCRQKMRICFKRDILDIATSFNNMMLIGDDCYSDVSGRSLTMSEKAEAMVQAVQDSVFLNPGNYGELMKILADNKHCDDLVQMTDEEYKKQGERDIRWVIFFLLVFHNRLSVNVTGGTVFYAKRKAEVPAAVLSKGIALNLYFSLFVCNIMKLIRVALRI